MVIKYSKFNIVNTIIFSSEDTIHDGNHDVDLFGNTMISIKYRRKRPENYLGMVIEDDDAYR